ncbi:MAG TPA: response regulator [Candidatus Acidoferrales bacterium]|nr:response regulator [Candidatus Acidoferrales bacterium]
MTADALPEQLLARMGYAVFEDAGAGALVAVGTPPDWFGRVFGADAAADGARFVPGDHSPYLENFLASAERVWVLGTGERAESGPWIESAPDGSEVALEAEAWVLDGRRILVVANQQERFEEISRRLQIARDEKLAHERLRREIQTKEVLLHCIVHDLSQPLTALRGCLSLLNMGLPPEKVREVVDVADRQTRKQEAMIRDVLKAFSSEMAALEAVKAGQTVDLAQGAREVVNEYRAAFASQGAELALDARLEEPLDWRVTGEPDRLRRIFTNYLENALRYSPSGTVVTVGAEENGNFLRAFVDDQGPGLPEGVTSAKLFRLFGKGKESTGKAGLGLYFCKITAERWGGSVGCENRPAGGTRFWFRLPRPRGAERTGVVAVAAAPQKNGAQTATLQTLPAPSSASQPVARPLRVLLADDLPINRQMIAELLSFRGHKVESVGNGKAAVEAVRARVFDVVLLDVEMPVMNGLEAARAIRAGELASGRRIPLFAVTANDSPEDREQIQRAGMDGHLLKPFDREDLYRLVEDAEGGSAGAAAAPPEIPKALAPQAPAAREAIVARFGGDTRLAAQLARMFLKDSPRLVGAVRRAAARRDSQALAHTAHALKGAVAHFGAQQARAAAARLEDLGKRGEKKGVKEGLAELVPAVDALRVVLAEFAGGRKAGGSKRRTRGRKG